MEEELKQLKKRIEELEKRPQYIPTYPPIYYPINTPLANTYPYHFHNGTPCWNNPCYQC